MQVRRFGEALAYEAPNHRDVRSLRLKGYDPDGPQNFSVGLSHYLPGGGAGPDSSPLERVYVVLAGELAVRCGGEEVRLAAMDSCYIGPGEVREVLNQTNAVATILVVMPYPQGVK